MNYWLSRHESATPEGPYPLSAIETLFNTKAIGEDAAVCAEGKKKWQPVKPVLRADWDRRHGVTKKRRERLVLKWVAALLCGVVAYVALMIFRADYNSPENVAARAARDEQYRKQFHEAEAAKAEVRRLQQAARYSIEPSVWDGSVSEAKEFIKRSVRDPSSVKYNNWDTRTNGDNLGTTVDFTAANGFGGPAREVWVFSFNRKSGELRWVLDASNAKVIYGKQ